MQIKQQPFNLLLPTGLVFICMYFNTLEENRAVDIALHDTYLVISFAQIWGAIGIMLLCLWGIYVVTKKNLYAKWLTWAHVGMMISAVFILFCIIYLANLYPLTPRRFYCSGDTPSSSWHYYDVFNVLIGISLIMIGIAQFIFIFNIVAGLLKRKRTGTNDSIRPFRTLN